MHGGNIRQMHSPFLWMRISASWSLSKWRATHSRLERECFWNMSWYVCDFLMNHTSRFLNVQPLNIGIECVLELVHILFYDQAAYVLLWCLNRFLQSWLRMRESVNTLVCQIDGVGRLIFVGLCSSIAFSCPLSISVIETRHSATISTSKMCLWTCD